MNKLKTDFAELDKRFNKKIEMLVYLQLKKLKQLKE